MSERIDVSIEHKHAPSEDGGRPHPNTCPSCGSHYRDDELDAHLRVCPQCGHHFPVHARERIRQLVDEDSFSEEAAELRSDDPLEFFDLRPYTERLAEAELSTGLGEAMLIGRAAIEDQPCELAVMEFGFMGGSMGRVVGEKFVRACESAGERNVPLVSVTASGGARMQEGILSLMQLPKTVCAVEDLRDAGGTVISVMAHPTTAGVLASFASLGDVILSEPGDHRRVVAVRPVAVELEPVLEQALDVVQRVRPIRVPRELDGAPDVLVARIGDEPVELLLQALELTGDTRAAEKRQAPQAAQLPAEADLGLTRHRRRAAAGGPPSAAARVGGRSGRRAHGGSWTPHGRSLPAASRVSSAARRGDR